MSKVSFYLQSHILGEVITRADIRNLYAKDGSILQQKPSMVIFPRTDGDVRKVLKFSSQLADKGYKLSVSSRGRGTSGGGSSLSPDIVIDMTHHLNKVFEYDEKQKLVRLQSGATSSDISNALRISGAGVNGLNVAQSISVGGWISEGVGDEIDNNYEVTRQVVKNLEVVLHNGEIIQTGPLSRRELNKKKGLQTAEGDIYRGVEAILEDFADVIEAMRQKPYRDMSGYPGICDVSPKKNSFDLTPLFVGAQGTLGIVTEAILGTDFKPAHTEYMILSFANSSSAFESMDIIRKQNPTFVDYFDGKVVDSATDQGVNLEWYQNAQKELGTIDTVFIVGWSKFGNKNAKSEIRKIQKYLNKVDCKVEVGGQDEDPEKLDALRDMLLYTRHSTVHINDMAPDIVGGFYIPPDKFDDLKLELAEMEKTMRIKLPIYGSALSSIYTVSPQISLQKIADKQKILRLVENLISLVDKYEGVYYAHGGEGWLTSYFARNHWPAGYAELTDAIRKLFDPNGLLSKNAKTDVKIKSLVPALKNDNTVSMPRDITSAR